MRAHGLLPALTLLLSASAARADSPLTSCDLQTGYDDLSLLQDLPRGIATPAAVAFMTGSHPLDEKIAVASTIGWSVGQPTGTPQALVAAFAARRKVPKDDLALRDLSPDDRAILGYALALADYFDLTALGVGNDLRQSTPKALLASAARDKPEDFAIAYLGALIEAQARMSKEKQWCGIYQGMAKVLDRFPEARRNLRPAAVAQCQAYIEGYREYCPHLRPPPEEAEELDQVYALALQGSTLLAGTQGGAVALDTRTGQRLAVAPDFICADVALAGEQALFGCRRGLYLYEAGRMKKLRGRKDRGEQGFELLRQRDGTLQVIDGRSALAWDGRGLVKGGVVPAPGAYARVVRRRDGVLWSIDFLRAVHAGPAVLPIKGAYPGRDPRSFVEDAAGDLWILDFDDGVFHFDDATQHFSRAGPSSQGSGVDVDPQRGRRVFLHYRDGLLIEQSGQTRAVPLPQLEYLRAMLVAPDGTIWVAGWHGVARVSSSGAIEIVSLRGTRRSGD